MIITYIFVFQNVVQTPVVFFFFNANKRFSFMSYVKISANPSGLEATA